MASLTCPQRVDRPELMDSPETSLEDIRGTLRDQALINRWLGGARASMKHLLPLLPRPASAPITVLDAACGGADLSRLVVDEARRLGRSIEVTALDLNPSVLAYARGATVDYPEIAFVQADALSLPFGGRQFDIVLMSTFLHHLPPQDVVSALRRATEVSRGWIIAADLRRSSVARLGFALLSRLAGFNPISIHDGAVSVCRAYTPRELADLATQAGMDSASVHLHSFFRMTLVYDTNAAVAEVHP